MIKDIEQTYVAIIDILGFKELAYNNNHQELIKIYDLFDKVIKNGLARFNNIKENAKIQIDVNAIKINSLTISDSLILWTDNLECNHFLYLLYTVVGIHSEAMRCGIPLRGAIVSGPLSIREERLLTTNDNVKLTCFGKSIVDAYLLCEKQNWSGCIISKDCMTEYQKILNEQSRYTKEQVEKHFIISSFERKKLLRKYFVPFKEGELSEEYVINWVNELTPKMNKLSIRNSFGKYNKSVNNWKVETIIRNTVEFSNSCP